MIGTGDSVSVPIEKLRWDLAKMFHWTLDYIDALEMKDLHEYLQVQDGEAKAGHSLLKKGIK